MLSLSGSAREGYGVGDPGKGLTSVALLVADMWLAEARYDAAQPEHLGVVDHATA